MSGWWTYTLSDFLLFSPRTYYRLLELYNFAIWPVQIVAVGIGIAILAAMVNRRNRTLAGLLALCWLWIAWAFHYQRYAQINWVASWFAAAFALQGLLLIMLGVIAGRAKFQPASNAALRIATSIVAIAVFGYPFLALLTGRAWTSAETFGVMPDPTAIATVAALALVRGTIRWLLLIVPLLWCAVAAATLWTMGAPEAIVVVAATVVALWLAAGERDRDLTEPTEG
jgi:hypothetical protein